VPQNPPAPLPANVFTNIPGERREATTSATVVLFDTLHTQVLDQPYARQQFVKFLQQIHPEDRVAVYALGRRIRILSDFTNDAQRLLAASPSTVDRTRASPNSPTPIRPITRTSTSGRMPATPIRTWEPITRPP